MVQQLTRERLLVVWGNPAVLCTENVLIIFECHNVNPLELALDRTQLITAYIYSP